MGTTILELLRVFLIALGAIAALWGVYDVFLGDNGGQSAVGTKKIIGGIGFAILAGIVLTMVITDIEKAEDSVDIAKTSFHQAEMHQQISDDIHNEMELIV